MHLSLRAFSTWIEQTSQPDHPYYHPLQIALFANVTYITTTCLTTLPFRCATMLVISTYAISQLVTPLFIDCFQPYQDTPLIPFFGHVIQMTLSVILAKMSCNLMGCGLSLKQIRQASLAFLITLFVCRFILIKLRQQLNLHR